MKFGIFWQFRMVRYDVLSNTMSNIFPIRSIVLFLSYYVRSVLFFLYLTSLSYPFSWNQLVIYLRDKHNAVSVSALKIVFGHLSSVELDEWRSANFVSILMKFWGHTTCLILFSGLICKFYYFHGTHFHINRTIG